MDNYYKILNLSIERYVSDISEIEAALEKKKNEWNSSNNTNIRSYVDKYIKTGVIKNAYTNPDEWKKLYTSAKNETDSSIKEYLDIVNGKGYVTEAEIAACAGNKSVKTSENYVRIIAGNLGMKIQEDVSKHEKTEEIKLSDFEPKSTIKFSSPAKELSKISCRDYYDFLTKYSVKIGKSTSFSPETNPSVCVAMAVDIKKEWSGKKEDMEKSAVEKVCSSIVHFDRKDDAESQENYNQYLTWSSLKAILDKIWQPLAASEHKLINDIVKANTVNKLVEIIHDRKKSEGILTSFCKEKGISMPQKMPDYSSCFFCGITFQKNADKPLTKCPVCGKSFILKCPKCGKSVNCSESTECCGFNFGKYSYIKGMCDETFEYISSLSFDLAEQKINDINNQWNDFPGLEDLKKELYSKKKLVGDRLKKLKKCLSEKKMYSALAEYEGLKRAVSAYSDSYLENKIKTSVSEADRLFRESKTEKDQNNRLRILMKVLAYASDHPSASGELSEIKPSAPENFSVITDQTAGCVNLMWKSDNPDDTAEYVVRRKKGGKIISSEDGEEIVRTFEKAYSDKSVTVGSAYFYAVYAMRGDSKSKLALSDKPSILCPKIENIDIVPGETMIQVSWNNIVSDMKTEVFRNDSADEKDYNKGKKIECSLSGFTDNGLDIDKTYYYNIFLTFDSEDGLIVYSAASVNGRTHKIAKPVRFHAEETDKDGEFILKTDSLPESGYSLQFFSSRNSGISLGTSVQINKFSDFFLKKINVVPISEKEYKISLPVNTSFYIYAVCINSSTGIFSDAVPVEHLQMIKIKNKRNDGVNLYIELENWPEGHELMYVTYNNDKYPTGFDDCSYKISINKLNYKRSGIQIRDIEQKNYYITGFVKTPDGEKMVFKTEFINRKKTDINYNFGESGFGPFKKWKLHISLSESTCLPEMSLRYLAGRIPIYNTDGAEGMVIPYDENPKGTKNFEFIIPFKVRKGIKARLFLKNDNEKDIYQLKIDPRKKSDLI